MHADWLAGEMVLCDADAARAEGEAMDLDHGVPFVRPVRIRAGGYDDLVVIAAGSNQRPGETRLDLLQENVAVFRDISCPGSSIRRLYVR